MKPDGTKMRKRRREDLSSKSSSSSSSSSIKCSSALLQALTRGIKGSHRSLCVLLSDKPGGELSELIKGWRGIGGKGKGVVICDDEMDRWRPLIQQDNNRLRCISWSALSTGRPIGSKLGYCVVTDPLLMTPSILASLAESLQGGGMFVMILPKITAWEEVRSKGGAGGSQGPGVLLERLVNRFPECRSWLLLDSHLNPLPTSTGLKASKQQGMLQGFKQYDEDHEDDMDLDELKECLADTRIVGDLVKLTSTVDQARILLTFFESASEKSVSGTVAVSGPRGRGKSSAIGLCLASAVAYGYSNIFLTAQSPEAAQSIFQFCLKGFDALDYVEEKDYDLIQGVGEGGGNAQVLLRINIFREHRQTIQFIYPTDAAKLEQAEFLAIDDAASFDPEVLRRLLGPYLMLVCSTVGGSGGAGPSTAARVIEQLKAQASSSASQVAAAAAAEVKGSQTRKGERQVHEERWRKAAEAVSALGSTRSLVEVATDVPVHWASKDPLERWVTKTLGLGWEAIGLRYGTPAPWDCELFYVDRQALFSGHSMTEQLLERLLHVYGAWDRMRDPNRMLDLVNGTDHLMVLLSPEAEEQSATGGLPDILAIVHIRMTTSSSSSGGAGASNKAGLPSAEVVHLATHPDVMRMGYGSRTLQLLGRYLRGEVVGGGDDGGDEQMNDEDENGQGSHTPVTELPKPRTDLPPVLASLEEKGFLWGDDPSKRPHEMWVKSVSTSPAWGLKFWGRADFRPIALQETPAAGGQAGIPTVSMALGLLEAEDLEAKGRDFQCQALRLLPSKYSTLGTFTALGLVQIPTTLTGNNNNEGAAMDIDITEGTTSRSASRNLSPITAEEQAFLFTGHDLKRLEMYSKSLVDHTMVSDLLPLLGQLFFQGRLPGLPSMPDLQSAILLGLGMQRKRLETMSMEVQLPPHQVLALFNKAVRRLSGCLQAIQEADIEAEMASSSLAAREAAAKDHHVSLPIRLEEEMEMGAKQSLAQMKSQQEEVLKNLDVMKYAVKGTAEDWQEVLKDSKAILGNTGMVQIRSVASSKATGVRGRPDLSGFGDDDDEDDNDRRKGRGKGGGFKRGGGQRDGGGGRRGGGKGGGKMMKARH